MATTSEINNTILAALKASKDPVARKAFKVIDPASKGPLQKLAMNMLQKQVQAILDHDDDHGGDVFEGNNISELTPDQWSKIITLLGPFLQMLLKLLGLG